MDNKSITRILERETAIKEWLKDVIEVQDAKLPIMPEKIFEALESINVPNAIQEFASGIVGIQDFLNENNVQALVYEWFYDGGEVNNIHADTVYAYKTCFFDGKPGDTDELNLPNYEGFEMNPELDNQISQACTGFCLDPVMNVWYENLAPEFKSKFNEYYNLNDEAEIDVDLDLVENAYNELFQLKLVSLLREAYFKTLKENPIKITTENPLHIFIKRHERWPMHVLSLNV